MVCGPSGTGKAFPLEALGQATVEVGKHVAWFTLEQPGMLIRRHCADSLSKAISRILRADLVVVDDIGLPPSAPTPLKGSTAWSMPPMRNEAWPCRAIFIRRDSTS